MRSAQTAGPDRSQHVSVAPHTGPDELPQWQMPLEHVSSASQAIPHPPQSVSSLLRLRQEVPQHVEVIVPLQLLPVPPQRQLPDVHSSPESQVVPQLPQLASSELRSTHAVPQQKLAVVPAQSGPVPPQLHEPVTHISPVWQATPQPPQLFWSAVVLRHEEPQHTEPGAPVHTGPKVLPQRQIPDPQVSPVAHIRPHVPQFASSVPVFTQLVPQHSCDEEEHASAPGVEEPRVVPHSHRSSAALQVSPAPHAAPHAPQLPGSIACSQPGSPSQSRKPALHTQAPPVQVSCAPHASPQTAQSVIVPSGVSQPVDMSPSQSARPAVQPHVPPLHSSVPAQVVPQPPQFVRSLDVRVSHPSVTPPAQSAKPGLHEPIWQTPATQVPLPFATSHRVPQPPQFALSVVVSISQPSRGAPLQSAQPESHTSTLSLQAW
ncbi:MAG: hypothetical protein H6719_21490 [Sandaracinaceae bacterium]|nr:hypothetical protein [Sandaracinaceae bacterium]